MKKLAGFLIISLTLSAHVAFGQDEAPPFSTLLCESENVSVQVKIQNYRQTYGAGPAVINGNGTGWRGSWSWKSAREGTRLTGHHFLNVKANDQNGSGPFYLRTLYNGANLSGGWLDMSGFSGPVNCKIEKVEAEQKLCKVLPQNNCSVSPKRLCCYCANDQLLCY